MATRKTDPPRGILDPAVHGQMITLDRYAPSADLADLVEHYWVVEWSLPKGETYRAENLPHPSVHLVFEGRRSYVQGVHTERFVYTARGCGRVFAARFRPGGFYPFFRAPVSLLSDRRAGLQEVLGPAAKGLPGAIAACDDVDGRIGVLEEFLRARDPVRDPRIALVAEVIERIGCGAGVRQVADLERLFAISRRSLEAIFSRYVGVGPKWVIRRFRMHEALERLHAGETLDTGLLALDLGYSDQAHFIRDFKAMTGRTPARYGKTAAGQAGRPVA